MATQEKLLKSLESLKNLINSPSNQDQNKKKEKLQHCSFISEALLNPTIKIAKNFNNLLSFTVHILLQLCDDNESDVRMIADECLNKIIKGMSHGNITKIQVELHTEIKHNGSARSLRAALWRFSLLAHYIRPNKGKPYVINLIPCLVNIFERNEEIVHETLVNSLPRIMIALGCFTMDSDIKSLLTACFKNILSTSTVIRRSTASCILTIVLNSRKPYVFLLYVLNNIIDNLIPVLDGQTSNLILGTLGCLKIILPHIKEQKQKLVTSGFSGGTKDFNENKLLERYLQIYELSFHFSSHSDHNVVNASLETLNSLFLYGSPEFYNMLKSSDGITKSRILYQSLSKLNIRSPSQLSIATTLKSEDNFLLDSELNDTITTDIEKWIDESKLSVINVNYVKDELYQPDIMREIENDFKNVGFSKNCDYSNISIGTIQDNYNDNMYVDNIDDVDKTILSENSSEKSFSTKMDEKSLAEMEIFLDIDIGDFLDKQISLMYAARYIAKQFLLGGIKHRLIPDKKVRVSTKNLALTCLSNIVQIYPNALLIYLNKYCAKDVGDAKDILKQQISDVFLFKDHSDPQLRGVVRIIISNFIKAVLLQNYAVYDNWILKNSLVNDCDVFSLKNLLEIILKGLQQENSTCSRQTLISLNTCLKYLLETDQSKNTLEILNYIPILSTDPYWLVKVKLLEVVSELNYITIRHVTGSNEFQNRVIYNILFYLLSDEDQRVRSAAVTSIIRIIPSLYFGGQYPNESSITIKAIYHRNKQIPMLVIHETDSNIKCKQSIENMPFPYHTNQKYLPDIEESLSTILFKLYQQFLQKTSKYFTSGFIELLTQLSSIYPTTIYKIAWNCFKNVIVNEEMQLSSRLTLPPCFDNSTNLGGSISSSGDLFNILINLLTNSTIGYDLHSHLNLLKVSGNIFAGKSIESIKEMIDINPESNEKNWIIFEDKKFSELSEVFLVHLLKLLNIYSHIMDETTPTIPQIKLPNLPSTSSLSPIKRKKSDLGDKKIISPGKSFDKEGDKKIDLKISGMGSFATNPHYMKIYEIVRSAYNNYKITIDPEASANFVNFLEVILFTLSQILEIATLKETGRIAEEILFYLKSTFTLASTASVQCVRQLLKSLFSMNLSADADNIIKYINKSTEKNLNYGFYNNIAQKPVEDLSFCIHSLQKVSKVDCNGDSTVMGYLHRKESKKTDSKSVDTILANYIRIFEPIVIKALKHYTITSNVKLQSQVLQLLSQLVQLRVNYCLLDSEQIFIGFVLKQFEYIEEGQILLPEEIIPKIFHFLVNLSYGKHHSKSIIVIPKIIQLCDGLMASGQSPLTHCIPSLKPTVEDVFLLRNKSNTPDFKELETTREVLVSILCRLIEYSEVMDLLVLILNESKYCENSEKWSRWSKQILEILLPLLKQDKVRLDDEKGMECVKKLIFSLHPCIYESINDILIVLFSEPPEKKNIMSKYLGKVLVSFLIITQLKEDVLLLKLVENQERFSPESVFIKFESPAPDPLNVTKTLNVFKNIFAEDIFIQFCFRIIYFNVKHCLDIILMEEDQFIVQQFHNFLLYLLYIFQSGNYPRITEKAILLLSVDEECAERDNLPIDSINECFIKLQNFYPLLTFHWCYLLTLLNYNNRKFWSTIMQLTETYGINRQIKDNTIIQKKDCCNMEIVRIGGSIVFSDYLSEHILSDGEQMSWFLVNNINFIVNYNKEAPVFELLGSVHRNSAASGLVLQAIVTKCLDKAEASTKSNILNCLENVHPSQTGTLLLILIPKLLNTKELSVSRQVSKLASRKVEYLLTLTSEEVVKHLPKEDLLSMMEMLISMKLAKKHETLVSLLNKLASQFYDLSPLELDQQRLIKADYIKKLMVDQNWFISQIKLRCYSGYSSSDIGELLYTSSYDELILIMGHPDFNKNIILESLNWCINNTERKTYDLLKACSSILLKDVGTVRSIIPKPHQVYKPEGRDPTPSEIKYSSRLTDILWDESVFLHLNQLIPCIPPFIKCLSIFQNDHTIPDSHFEDFVKLAVLCLENIIFVLNTSDNELNINFVNICLKCSNFILNETYLCNVLGQSDFHITWLCSAVNSIYKLVNYLLKDMEPLPAVNIYNLNDTLTNIETRPAGQAVYQLSVLFTWLKKKKVNYIPKSLMINIQSIVISLSRMPLVNSYILTPPTAWKTGWNVPLVGPFFTQVPLLPIEYLQDVEILEEFIFGINLLGWTSRQQFEETWMCLLGVLCASPTEESSQDEINAITHSTSLAVQAITSLLLQTLYLPHPGNKNNSKLIHVSRDRKIDPTSLHIKKLKEIHNNFLKRVNKHCHILKLDKPVDVFNNPNIEKIGLDYSYSQLSVEYLQISAKIVENMDEESYAVHVYKKRQNIISHIGLDLNSCLQFLLDLYTQWIKSDDNIQLRLLQEVVKSILIISDLFTERSQFQWMLQIFLDLSKMHLIEDEIIHQYIVIGVCKSIAVLSSDLEHYEYAKKLITQNLKSPFLSARISSIHGLLYILQMCVLGNTVIGGISDEMRLFLPIGIDYVQCCIDIPNKVLNQSLEHTLLVWSLAFYLIEHLNQPFIEETFIESAINHVLFILNDVNSISMPVYISLIGGLERLLIKKKIPPKTSCNILTYSLEKLKSTNPSISLPASQLLFTCIYTEYSNQLESTEVSNGIVESNPDYLEQTIEKVTALFDKVKKGFPLEVEILCSSMSIMLSDFFTPSDILTKAIGEFLSPQQRHPIQLSTVVFKIFESAIKQSQLLLLQDWVVFSLGNFTHSFSIGMATWCLTCFFISASTNPWLRALFPIVQKRIGRYEYEDRKILCIAGADFYNNLSYEGQKHTFVDTLNKVKDKVDMPFKELLECL